MLITMYSWTRNTLVILSILTILYFSRWRPIWPPNHNNSHISAHKHDRKTNLVSITMYSWTRNPLLAFSILATFCFPRWRPIWPPNHNNSHISAHKHDRETNLVSITMYLWTRNTLVVLSILTILYFSRWRPIWQLNHNNSHISAHKHDRETNLVSTTMYSWTRNTLVVLSILTILYFSRWRPIWQLNHNNSHISAHKHDRETNLVSITMYSWTRNPLLAFSILATICFPRWRPIWPPNHNNSHISAHKHDRKTNLVSITMYSWTRNPLLAFSIFATFCFPRWRPIWPPNHNNSHISAHKHDRETKLVSKQKFRSFITPIC